MAPLALLLCVPVALWRDRGFVAYWLRHPSAFDARSLADVVARDGGSLAAALLICLACWGVGLRVLRRLLPGERGGLLHCYAFALGLGAVGWSVFALGLAGVLTPAGLAVLAAAAVLAAGPRRLLAELRALRPPKAGVSSDAAVALSAGALALAAWNTLIVALAPATAWDVLAYHLALPKIYLKEGRALELPWLIHSHWPHLMEAFYALPLTFGGDGAAALVHAAACAALVAAIWLTARRELGLEAAWIGAALFAAQPSLHMVAGTAHADGALALFVFLAVSAAYDWKRTGRDGYLAAASLLAGFAACAKLHGAVALAALALWVAVRSPRRAAAFAAAGLALAAPWFLKTAAGTGNPLWPFFSSALGGRFGAAAVESDLLRSSRWSWPPDASLVLEFGPQYLLGCLAALLVLTRAGARKLPAWPALGLGLGSLYFAAIARQRDAWRFFLPFIPFLCLAAGWYASRAARGWRRAAALAAVLLGVWPSLAIDENNALFPVAALRSQAEPDKPPRELYLERMINDYRLMRASSSALPPGAKILLFQEIRGYYLDRDYEWGDPLNQGVLRYSEIASPGELRARLKERGITHVLVNRGLGMYQARPGYYEPRTLALMDGALAGAAPVLRDGDAALFALP